MTSSFTCRLFIRAPFEPESILLTDTQNPKLFSRATQKPCSELHQKGLAAQLPRCYVKMGASTHRGVSVRPLSEATN
jgi:hypothetical protein